MPKILLGATTGDVGTTCCQEEGERRWSTGRNWSFDLHSLLQMDRTTRRKGVPNFPLLQDSPLTHKHGLLRNEVNKCDLQNTSQRNAFINITDPEQIGRGLAKVHLKDTEEMGCLEWRVGILMCCVCKALMGTNCLVYPESRTLLGGDKWTQRC